MPRNVQVCMTDLMAQLIDEVSSLPDETLALILEQFEKVSDGQKGGHQNEAYIYFSG